MWCSPVRYRWVRLRLRYSCDLLPEFPCRLCRRSLSRCHRLPSLPRCRLQPCRHDVQGHDRGHQHLWFQLHHSGCSNGFLLPFRCRSAQWLLSTHRSCDRGHPYNLQHNYRRRCKYKWYSPVRCRWVRFRLRYSCDRVPEYLWRVGSPILSRCHRLPSLSRCRSRPCRRDVQGHDRGHLLLWFQLHHSHFSNVFLLPFLYKLVR